MDKFDPIVAKPAHIKRYIEVHFSKEVSYAQLAYEMSKRKNRIMGSTVQLATTATLESKDTLKKERADHTNECKTDAFDDPISRYLKETDLI